MFLCGSALVFLCLSMRLCHLVPVSRCFPLTVCVPLCVPVTFCFLSHSFLCVTLNISVPASGFCVPPTQYPFFFLYRSLSLGGSVNQPSRLNPAGWGWTSQSVLWPYQFLPVVLVPLSLSHQNPLVFVAGSEAALLSLPRRSTPPHPHLPFQISRAAEGS